MDFKFKNVTRGVALVSLKAGDMFTVIEQGASCGMEMVVSGCGDKVLIFNFEMKKMLLMDKVTPVMRYRTETELKGFSAPIHLSDVEAGDSIVFPHKKDVYILLEIHDNNTVSLFNTETNTTEDFEYEEWGSIKKINVSLWLTPVDGSDHSNGSIHDGNRKPNDNK